MGRKIKIGYLKVLPESNLISAMVIENNFINLLGRYADIKIIPINKGRIEEDFKRVKRYSIDYLYVTSFNLLQIPFFLREKLKMDIPFIFYIHAVFPWYRNFIHIIPFLREYDRIFAPSKYAKNLFLKLSSKFIVRVVPHCVDFKTIQGNLSTNPEKNNKIITYMGRMTEEKGVGALIESFPKIMAKIGNARLNLIGPLSGQGMKNYPKSRYVKQLEELVRRRRLTNRVTFKGIQLSLDKYRILSGSDIFVNPTLAKEETFGMVNIEALACGVPVVATDWAGNREIIENDKNGYLLKVNRWGDNQHFDNGQMASKIIMVLSDKDLNARLKKNATASAKKYDYRIIMPRLVGSLKKRRHKAAVRGRWDYFKDKAPCDFVDSFNNEFLFYLFYINEFRNETYSSLYNKAINKYTAKNGRYETI